MGSYDLAGQKKNRNNSLFYLNNFDVKLLHAMTLHLYYKKLTLELHITRTCSTNYDLCAVILGLQLLGRGRT